MPRKVASAVAAGDYYTDEKRLVRVEKIVNSVVVCEDAGDPALTVEVSLDELATMRRIEVSDDGD